MPQYQSAILQLVGLLQADQLFLFVSVFDCGAAQLLVNSPFGFRLVPLAPAAVPKIVMYEHVLPQRTRSAGKRPLCCLRYLYERPV